MRNDHDKIVAMRDKLGPWGHSYQISPEVWTRDDEPFLNWRVSKFEEIMRELQLDVTKIRLLDLACLDGLFSIEFGKRGAVVHGVDIRPDNISRSKFGAEVNNLDKVTFEINDVLNLSNEANGQFDVVLCCGLFYHLTAEDCLKLLHKIRSLTSKFCFLDTHISFESHIIDGPYPLGPVETMQVDGRSYKGRLYVEFDQSTPMDIRMSMPSSSVHNDTSFWFTRESLYEACAQAGFRIRHEAFGNPNVPVDQQSRPLFILEAI